MKKPENPKASLRCAVIRETGAVCPDWMVERRGFELMVIVT